MLYDPQTNGEPLLIEFKDNVFVGNEDQIICEITNEQAIKILDASIGSCIEDNIRIPADVESYILNLKKERKVKEI